VSFKPNVRAARDAFAERVTEAYLKTWHGFGFVGSEFNEDRAKELGLRAADFAFPYPAPPVVNIEGPDLANILSSYKPGTIIRQPTFDADVDAPCGDGVVGD
jgi:hypothetical protein